MDESSLVTGRWERFSARSASRSIGNGCRERAFEGEEAFFVVDEDTFEEGWSNECESRKLSKRLEDDLEALGEVVG